MRRLKEKLDYFLGIKTPGKNGQIPDDIRVAINDWKKMKRGGKLPKDLKEQGWLDILEKRSGSVLEFPEKTEGKITNLKGYIGALAALLVAALLIGPLVRTGYKGRLLETKNSVFVNDQKISGDYGLNSGDVIRTGDDSSVRLIFADKNILEIGANAEVQYLPGDEGAFIKINRGLVFAVIKAAKKTGGVSFQTSAGDIVVRGTSLVIRAETSDTTYLCICHGRVDIQSKNGEIVQTVAALHHGGYSIIQKDGQTVVSGDGMLYHQDHHLEENASRIGEKIKWRE